MILIVLIIVFSGFFIGAIVILLNILGDKKRNKKQKSLVINYFEDEELDRFKNKSGNSYTQSEVEEFKKVLQSLPNEKIKNWLESLEVREVVLPDEIKTLLFK